MNKEIHFYTNLCNEDQTSEWDLESMKVDYASSVRAISDPEEDVVKTTQLCLLVNAWDYLDLGYKVFIHNRDQILEVKEHMEGSINGKDIRVGHNLCHLLLGGNFGEIA